MFQGLDLTILSLEVLVEIVKLPPKLLLHSFFLLDKNCMLLLQVSQAFLQLVLLGRPLLVSLANVLVYVLQRVNLLVGCIYLFLHLFYNVTVLVDCGGLSLNLLPLTLILSR